VFNNLISSIIGPTNKLFQANEFCELMTFTFLERSSNFKERDQADATNVCW